MLAPTNSLFPASPLQVFAVEAEAMQLCWGNLPAAEIQVSTRTEPPGGPQGSVTTVEHRGGPGSLELTDLRADTTYVIHLSIRAPGARAEDIRLTATTLKPPDGARLCKLATVSDLHIGARHFGALRTMKDPEPEQKPFAFRCARSAIEDAISWGAEYLVIKGDALHAQSTENIQVLGSLLDEFADLPMMLLPGNHDVDGRGDLDTLPPVGSRQLPFVRGVVKHELPGLRVVGADTTIAGKGVGGIAEVGHDIVAATRGASPVLIAIHQQLQHHKLHYYWPPGIPHQESATFLESLATATPNAFLTSGHTHRNRARTHQGLTLTEVASTRDWPGVWAGYTVYEGGITQVVRRASAPSAMRWHEYGRQALAGLWSLWSPGRIQDRCLGHNW